MSYSNETETLKLPQYGAEDKPSWLVDVNESFAKIDVFAKNTNEEIENIHTHEQETANTLESVARTLESQSDTNTDIEKRVTKNTEDLTLLTTHVNEHDNNLKYVESEINGLSMDVENKAEKTEVETLQENLTSANNAINALEESENDFEMCTPYIVNKMTGDGSVGGTATFSGFRYKNILMLNIQVVDSYVASIGSFTSGRFNLADILPNNAKYTGIKDFESKKLFKNSSQSVSFSFSKTTSADGSLLGYSVTGYLPNDSTKHSINNTIILELE